MVSKVASTARISAVLARKEPLLRLEQQDRAVAQVEVDEVLRLCDSVSPSHILLRMRMSQHTMRDEAAEVSTNDAVPCRTFPLVELGLISIERGRSTEASQTVRLMWWAIS